MLFCDFRYIDPTYMIRAVPANAFDSIYCSVLAQMAVHAALAPRKVSVRSGIHGFPMVFPRFPQLKYG